MGTVILVHGEPRSSCCSAVIECEKDYTDTHLYEVVGTSVGDDGQVVAAQYRFVKTLDGIDGSNWRVKCGKCGTDIDDESIDFEEA